MLPYPIHNCNDEKDVYISLLPTSDNPRQPQIPQFFVKQAYSSTSSPRHFYTIFTFPLQTFCLYTDLRRLDGTYFIIRSALRLLSFSFIILDLEFVAASVLSFGQKVGQIIHILNKLATLFDDLNSKNHDFVRKI